MARALSLLALLSAFFVVAVRCLGGPAASSANAPALHSAAACPSSGDDDDQAATADLDDDSDDGVDPLPALAASAPVRLVTFMDTKGRRLGRGAAVAERPLPSHAASLERPPRA
ncbi:MAG: hypothetical protein ABJB12_21480 [Pseudomonadota bacterium]